MLSGLCFPGKEASILCLQTKAQTIIWKKKTRKQLCHDVTRKWLNSSTTATLKTAPSTGTREKSGLIKCVSIHISPFSAKYKIFLNILDIDDFLDAIEMHDSILFYFHEPLHH